MADGRAPFVLSESVASPIVIDPKKNGVDISLCIDYKIVNAVTVGM